MLSDLDSRDPLQWLSRILWPDDSTEIVQAKRTGGGHTRYYGSTTEWWASPTTGQPNILIPAGAPAAAKTAVRRYHDGFSTKRRLRSLLAEGVMTNDRLARLSLHKNRVVARGESGFGRPASGVLDHIRELVGLPEMFVAISLSTPKSNQKPVLQLLDGSGQCRGWAKVAWNARTESLVGTEAYWLQRAGMDRPCQPPLSMPTLLQDSQFEGRRIVITSGVDPTRRKRRSPFAPPATNIFRAVNALGSVDTMPIDETAWWQSVIAVIDGATQEERLAIEAVAERCSRLRFQVGAWHGDLTPWNLMTSGSSVQLIDWEFAADGAPLGFDLCHFHTQVASEMKGHDTRDALDYSARVSPHGLAELGVAAENRTATWQLYLVELLRRLLALRIDGYPTEAVTQGPAALARLEHALGLGRQTTSGIDHSLTGTTRSGANIT